MAITKQGSVSSVAGVLGGKKVFSYDAVFPTAGDFAVGDLVYDQSQSASQHPAYVVTRAGSIGTFTGRTGTITQSSFSLTVNSSTGINVGTYLTISGVTGTKTVTAMNRTTGVATLDVASDATVTAQALAYQAPSYVRLANNQAS